MTINVARPSLLHMASEAAQAFYTRNRWALSLTAMYVLGAGLITYYGWLEPSYLSYPRLPFMPKQAEYFDGEPAVLQVARCNSAPTERQYHLSHVLIREDPATDTCPRRTMLPAGGFIQIDAGCHTEDSAANPIPSGTCEGTYHVEGAAETQATVRTVYVPWHSSSFRIKHRPVKEVSQ